MVSKLIVLNSLSGKITAAVMLRWSTHCLEFFFVPTRGFPCPLTLSQSRGVFFFFAKKKKKGGGG